MNVVNGKNFIVKILTNLIWVIKVCKNGENMNKDDIDFIPYGMYCYEILDVDIENGKINIKLCPYWDRDEERPEQENGYCHYLGYGDWESEGTSLLWDQCKECQVNLFDDCEF